jgi:hypothetical protein
VPHLPGTCLITPNSQVLHTLLEVVQDERKESKKCLSSPPLPSFFFSNNGSTWICSKIFVEFHVWLSVVVTDFLALVARSFHFPDGKRKEEKSQVAEPLLVFTMGEPEAQRRREILLKKARQHRTEWITADPEDGSSSGSTSRPMPGGSSSGGDSHTTAGIGPGGHKWQAAFPETSSMFEFLRRFQDDDGQFGPDTAAREYNNTRIPPPPSVAAAAGDLSKPKVGKQSTPLFDEDVPVEATLFDKFYAQFLEKLKHPASFEIVNTARSFVDAFHHERVRAFSSASPLQISSFLSSYPFPSPSVILLPSFSPTPAFPPLLLPAFLPLLPSCLPPSKLDAATKNDNKWKEAQAISVEEDGVEDHGQGLGLNTGKGGTNGSEGDGAQNSEGGDMPKSHNETTAVRSFLPSFLCQTCFFPNLSSSPSCLPACLYSCLPAFLPACLSAFLPFFLPSFLPPFLPSFLPPFTRRPSMP